MGFGPRMKGKMGQRGREGKRKRRRVVLVLNTCRTHLVESFRTSCPWRTAVYRHNRSDWLRRWKWGCRACRWRRCRRPSGKSFRCACGDFGRRSLCSSSGSACWGRCPRWRSRLCRRWGPLSRKPKAEWSGSPTGQLGNPTRQVIWSCSKDPQNGPSKRVICCGAVL